MAGEGRDVLMGTRLGTHGLVVAASMTVWTGLEIGWSGSNARAIRRQRLAHFLASGSNFVMLLMMDGEISGSLAIPSPLRWWSKKPK